MLPHLKNFSLVVFLLFLFWFLLLPGSSWARTNVNDWYIENFESEIRVNGDSSLLITEKITADCGNASGKHGIFRIVPEELKTNNGSQKMPVKLESITDFNGKALSYSEEKNRQDKTLTWKIGDASKFVTGKNYYKITYRVKNTLNFTQPDFDELYWNLMGNFWDLEIDQFKIKLIFPEEVTSANSQVEYYTGSLGEKNKNLAQFRWIAKNELEFYSLSGLKKEQGVTVSITFPKNIFTPPAPTFWEKWENFLNILIALFIPLTVLLICFFIWRKYGRDPKIQKTIIPEFSVPENITPLEMGLILKNGTLENKFLSASLINLAVQGIIQIEETEEKIFFLKHKDLRLIRLPQSEKRDNPDLLEINLLEKLLDGREVLNLSSLKSRTSLDQELKNFKKQAVENIIQKGWLNKKGLTFKNLFLILGFIFLLIFSFFQGFSHLGAGLLFGCILSALVFFVFGFLMPQRTLSGSELLWKIKGFRLYLETAEKYRQQFYEKEKIFEKFLPYAMVFDLTRLWIKKMEEIYGADYFKNHSPTWYTGTAGSLTAFDAEGFSSQIENLSSSLASNVSSGSGAGGSGGAGGGGGGGGGGGW